MQLWLDIIADLFRISLFLKALRAAFILLIPPK